MKITINNKEIELKYSFRAMMIFEKITGESFNPKGITEIMVYFYSTILASDRDIALTFEDFMEWIDEQPQTLNDFSEWLTKIVLKNKIFSDKEETSESENDVDLKKN